MIANIVVYFILFYLLIYFHNITRIDNFPYQCHACLQMLMLFPVLFCCCKVGYERGGGGERYCLGKTGSATYFYLALTEAKPLSTRAAYRPAILLIFSLVVKKGRASNIFPWHYHLDFRWLGINGVFGLILWTVNCFFPNLYFLTLQKCIKLYFLIL